MSDRNTTQTVSKGRIVHYQSRLMVQEGVESVAAIVTRVHTNDMIDLTCFPVGSDTIAVTDVLYFDGYDAEVAKTQDKAWWWPPRV